MPAIADTKPASPGVIRLVWPGRYHGGPHVGFCGIGQDLYNPAALDPDAPHDEQQEQAWRDRFASVHEHDAGGVQGMLRDL